MRRPEVRRRPVVRRRYRHKRERDLLSRDIGSGGGAGRAAAGVRESSER